VPRNAPVGLTLGIDFGTSNSAAALIQADGSLDVIPLDGVRAEMPTALFFDSEAHTVLYGSAAMQAYLSGAEGRLLRSLKSLLGSPLMDEYTAVDGHSMRFFDIVVLFFKELKRRCEAARCILWTTTLRATPWPKRRWHAPRRRLVLPK
jgi:hypothetical chaperone protein